MGRAQALGVVAYDCGPRPPFMNINIIYVYIKIYHPAFFLMKVTLKLTALALLRITILPAYCFRPPHTPMMYITVVHRQRRYGDAARARRRES